MIVMAKCYTPFVTRYSKKEAVELMKTLEKFQKKYLKSLKESFIINSEI